jgi:DNA-binding GntR family transcriptional regulator
MAASIRFRPATPAEGLAELRLLIELPAVRRLADRGLSDQELSVLLQLADATMRAAYGRDVADYYRTDMAFHLGLLELTSEPAHSQIARLVLASDRTRPPEISEYHLMAREAREHSELVGLLADGLVSPADQLIRLHLSRLSASRPASAHLAQAESLSSAGA